MKKRSNDWIVGGVIIVAMVGIVAATLFMQQTQFGQKRLSISARFRDVGSVQLGSAVVIRGVHAGRVESISLADHGWVVVRMDLEEGIVLPGDPVVLVQASTLFGEWQAIITSRSAVPLNRDVYSQIADTVGSPAGSLPGAVLPDIAQLTTVAGGIAGNVASVAERVRTAFDDSAAIQLRQSIRSINSFSADLARAVRAQTRNLDSIAVHVRAGVTDLAAASEVLRATVSRAGAATDSGEVETIVRETQRAAVNMGEASDRVLGLLRALEASESNLRGVIGKADSVMGKIDRGEGSLGLLVNDPSLYHNTDSLLIDLRALIADIKKDPKRYFSLRVF